MMMLDRLLQWFRPKASRGWLQYSAGSPHGTPLDETEDGKLYQTVGVRDICPDCGHKGFYEGPAGGMSTNIFCMNRDCRSGFNVTQFGPSEGICQRIHKGDIRRYPPREQ